jgi:hypothetical protein
VKQRVLTLPFALPLAADFLGFSSSSEELSLSLSFFDFFFWA